MIDRTLLLIWIWDALLVIMTLSFCSSTSEGDALRAIQSYFSAQLNWSGNDPCQGWEGVKCFNRHVVELNLGEKGLVGTIPEELGLLKFLEVLNLTSNQIQGSIPYSFSNLTKLQKLDLRSCQMNGTLPSEVGKLYNMKYLYLSNNLFTGSVPKEWSFLVNLKYLLLSNNRLTGSFPYWLFTIHGVIMLDCNYLTGPKPTNVSESSYKGNCFDSDYNSHLRYCSGSSNCVAFFSQNVDYPPSSKRGKKRNTAIMVLACVVPILALVVVFGIIFMKKRRKQKEIAGLNLQNLSNPGLVTRETWKPPNGLRRYDLRDLAKATEAFSNVYELGFGGFGKVYKARLDDGSLVAIKRALPSTVRGHDQFQNEILLLSRLHHRCLVKLKGFCHEAQEQILVYEFMENGNLDDLLWGNNKQNVLSWAKRLEISVAIAQALDYLHSFVDPPVIHRDVKPSNILLDNHFNAKLSDFGISRTPQETFGTHISTEPAGTMGYLDPQYFLRRQLTTSSDVYSFGVLLLALVTGQKAIDHVRIGGINLVEWVKNKLPSGGIESVADPALKEDFDEEAMNTIVRLALNCADFDRFNRPSMKSVLSTLESLRSIHDSLKDCESDTSQAFLSVNVSAAQTTIHCQTTRELSMSFSTTTVSPR